MPVVKDMNVQLLSGKTTRLIVISTEKFSTDGFTSTKNLSYSHRKGICFFKDYTKNNLLNTLVSAILPFIIASMRPPSSKIFMKMKLICDFVFYTEYKMTSITTLPGDIWDDVCTYLFTNDIKQILKSHSDINTSLRLSVRAFKGSRHDASSGSHGNRDASYEKITSWFLQFFNLRHLTINMPTQLTWEEMHTFLSNISKLPLQSLYVSNWDITGFDNPARLDALNVLRSMKLQYINFPTLQDSIAGKIEYYPASLTTLKYAIGPSTGLPEFDILPELSTLEFEYYENEIIKRLPDTITNLTVVFDKRAQPGAILDNLPQKLKRLNFSNRNYFREDHLTYDSAKKLPPTLTYLKIILLSNMDTSGLPRGLKVIYTPFVSLSMDDIDNLPPALEELTVKMIPLVGTAEALLHLPQTLRKFVCYDWFAVATDRDLFFEQDGEYHSAFPPLLESAGIYGNTSGDFIRSILGLPLKTLRLNHNRNFDMTLMFPNTLTTLSVSGDGNFDMEALPEGLKNLHLENAKFSCSDFSTLPRNLENLFLRNVTIDNYEITRDTRDTGYIPFVQRLINNFPRYLRQLHIENIIINKRILTLPYEIIPYLPPYLNDLSIVVLGGNISLRDPSVRGLFSVEVTRRNMRSQSDLLMEFPKTLEKLFITPKPEIPLRFYPNLISFNGNTLPLRC